MQADRVGAGQERLEIDQLDAMVGSLLGADVRIDRQDRHLEGSCPIGNGLADLPQPDDSERPVAQLQPGELGSLPLSAANGRIGGRNLPSEPEQEGQGVLGGRDRIAGGGVYDGDPGPRCGFEIYVVDADARPTDDDEPAAGLDEPGVDLDLATNDKRVVFADQGTEIVAGQAGSLVDFVLSPQKRDAFRGQRLRDKDLHAATRAFRRTPRRCARSCPGSPDQPP